jgi:hypothetical protein
LNLWGDPRGYRPREEDRAAEARRGALEAITADYGISRTTARKAAREAAEVTRAREEEPLAPLDDADLEHSLTLALTTVTEALRRCREIIAQGREDQVTIGAANAATRALSALVVAAIRTGYLNPEDEWVRRRVERAERVYGRLIADLGQRAGLTDEQFESALERAEDEARFHSGLALSYTTSNGKEH